MIKKNVIWADSGPIESLRDSSNLRLSYRGALYINRLVRRAVYNFFVSCAVDAPGENALANAPPVDMLKACCTKEADLNIDVIAERVLALAKIVGEAEVQELSRVKGLNKLQSFRDEVAPSSIADEILTGLTTFLNKILIADGYVSGRTALMPSHAILEQVQEEHLKWTSHSESLSSGTYSNDSHELAN